jgi:glutamate racemase
MIAIYDSGIGGASVLIAVRAIAPDVDILYLADQAHVPYGDRSPDDIRAIALDCADWLVAQGAVPVVVACNTASAAALGAMRARYPDTPFVGMVPAVKPAAQHSVSGVIGVMATAATLQGQLLADVTLAHAPHMSVIGQPCHGLVEFVEAGDVDSPTVRQAVAGHVAPLIAAGADVLVLGCTHYPFLRAAIAAAAPGILIIDPAPAVAQQAIRAAQAHGATIHEHGQTTYYTTGSPAHLQWQIDALGLPPGTVRARTQEQQT